MCLLRDRQSTSPNHSHRVLPNDGHAIRPATTCRFAPPDTTPKNQAQRPTPANATPSDRTKETHHHKPLPGRHRALVPRRRALPRRDRTRRRAPGALSAGRPRDRPAARLVPPSRVTGRSAEPRDRCAIGLWPVLPRPVRRPLSGGCHAPTHPTAAVYSVPTTADTPSAGDRGRAGKAELIRTHVLLSVVLVIDRRVLAAVKRPGSHRSAEDATISPEVSEFWGETTRSSRGPGCASKTGSAVTAACSRWHSRLAAVPA